MLGLDGLLSSLQNNIDLGVGSRRPLTFGLSTVIVTNQYQVRVKEREARANAYDSSQPSTWFRPSLPLYRDTH